MSKNSDIYAIYGASGFGRQIAPHIKQKLIDEKKFNNNLLFVDDEINNDTINFLPCISFSKLLDFRKNHTIHVAICISNSKIRERIWHKCLNNNLQMLDVKAKSSEILDQVELGMGSILCSYSMLTSNIKVGIGLHLNHYSYIAHDCLVGDFVTLAAGVRCSGNVHIADHVYIGSGAIIKQGTSSRPLRIGKGAVIGMGAVVTKDVPAGAVMVGNPARPLIKS